MASVISLEVVSGKELGQDISFGERMICLMGRAEDCGVQLPNDKSTRYISRYHCLLDINPPHIRVRDFGSMNGTLVNGARIGKSSRSKADPAEVTQCLREHDLFDGDIVTLGDTSFRVRIRVTFECRECGVEFEERQISSMPGREGFSLCEKCRRLMEASTAKVQPKEPDKDVAKAPGKPERRTPRKGLFGLFPRSFRGQGNKGGVGGKNEAAQKGLGVFGFEEGDSDASDEMAALLERGGRFEVIRELGRGGMGSVYLVRSKDNGELSALKVMRAQGAVQKNAGDLFLREAENTLALDHPNVVKAKNLISTEGVFCIILEYCDGGSVGELLRRRGGKLPLDEALHITRQCLEGLSYTHTADIPYVKLSNGSVGRGRGLVHRDIKPQNLLLCHSGDGYTIKIGDYGLAKAFDAAGLSGQTFTGATMGTPLYMPRQQIINFKYAQPDVDVWAMAATLYKLLTGSPPRDFQKNKDVWHTVLQTDAIPIRNRKSDIPKGLAQFLDHALVDNPEIFFKTIEEFRDALEKAL